ncbi:M23 family metallopeptidase [Dehalobacterium formicoaceticum]|uniref:M23 family metallopeptidase n=1 Tax=Dehalobacterium formicoaceticum TaxID=51515 RepID=UPI000B7C74ED|nr:M23 family metallopeptidase [Dehalobacterium formicoaceticum]
MRKATKNTWAVLILAAMMMVFVPMNALAENKTNEGDYRIAHSVAAGETLKSICRNYGWDIELVAAMNNLDPEASLSQEMVVYIPREPETNYMLQAGDTLWSIAQRNSINVDVLAKHNQLPDPTHLKAGDMIRIPDESQEIREPVRLADEKNLVKIASRSLSDFLMPVIGVISSPYGPRKSGSHHGTDIAAEAGTPILAIKSGEVTFAGWRPIYGYAVTIDHGDEVKSVYGHASKLFVKEGQKVKQGQIIAKVGSTGRSTGPHLHLEVHVGKKTVDPMRYFEKI